MVALAGQSPHVPRPVAAYYDGAGVVLTPAPSASRTVASLGPWVFGSRLSEDKPLDKRLNLYVVIPGKQHQQAGGADYDHNLVVNALTAGKVREWDIYWCFRIDPSLNDDLRGEHDLIVAAQQFFKPADLFDMEDIPGRAALGEKAGMRSLADFKHLRRKDGALPRLLIIPARLAISASAESAELKAETGK
jgi:hypothetical protein